MRDEVRQLAQPLAEEAGYELVDVEHAFDGGRRLLRVRIDKPGGVTLADCETFSRRLSDCLDMNQMVAGSFRLEVSSPGVDRPLRSLDAIERFAGERAALSAHELHDGRRNFEGVLMGPLSDRVGIRTEDGVEHWFDWAEVKSARLIVDPWAHADKRPAAAPGSEHRSGRRSRGRRGKK